MKALDSEFSHSWNMVAWGQPALALALALVPQPSPLLSHPWLHPHLEWP